MTHRLIPLVLAVVVAALAAPVAAAQDNEAVAVNTEDEALVFVLAFDLHRTMDDVIDESNRAIAYASCERCRTIAIAFQVVLAMDAAEAVVPVNLAVAVNDECTECETLAFAYQLVLAGDQRVRLSGDGRARIKDIRKALRALRDSDAPLEQILAELERRAAELRELIETELVPVGRDKGHAAPPSDSGEASSVARDAPEEADEPPQAPVETPATTAEPTPATTAEPTPAEPAPAATAAPTPATTAEPTATPTAEPTAAPTPESTPTPTATPTPSEEPGP